MRLRAGSPSGGSSGIVGQLGYIESAVFIKRDLHRIKHDRLCRYQFDAEPVGDLEGL